MIMKLVDQNHFNQDLNLTNALYCGTVLYMIHYEVRFVKFIDVGFHVGGKSAVKYIVLQVHYANVEQFKSKL